VVPLVLRLAFMKLESSPFDFTLSSAQSALSFLSGRVRNITGDVRPVVHSDLNERVYQRYLQASNSTRSLRLPFSPAMQMMFTHDAICEWELVPGCIHMSAFHHKYERRRRRLHDWINDDHADLDLIFADFSRKKTWQKHSKSKLDAVLDVAKMNSLLLDRPHVRVRTIEESLHSLKEQCEANFEYQREFSQGISRSLANAHDLSDQFHAVTFQSNYVSKQGACGWIRTRKEFTTDAFWLEDWYDRIEAGKQIDAVSTFYINYSDNR
jgi:hypothetical protein